MIFKLSSKLVHGLLASGCAIIIVTFCAGFVKTISSKTITYVDNIYKSRSQITMLQKRHLEEMQQTHKLIAQIPWEMNIATLHKLHDEVTPDKILSNFQENISSSRFIRKPIITPLSDGLQKNSFSISMSGTAEELAFNFNLLTDLQGTISGLNLTKNNDTHNLTIEFQTYSLPLPRTHKEESS